MAGEFWKYNDLDGSLLIVNEEDGNSIEIGDNYDTIPTEETTHPVFLSLRDSGGDEVYAGFSIEEADRIVAKIREITDKYRQYVSE